MAFATIINKKERPGEVSCVTKEDGTFAYLYEFKEAGSDRTLIGKMPLVEEMKNAEPVYGEMANVGEKTNLESVVSYMVIQNDNVVQSDIFDNKKIVIKSDGNNRVDTVNRICEIFKERNEAERGEKKLFVKDVPNIVLSSARSILFQTMQLNAATNALFYDKYQRKLNDAINEKMQSYPKEIQDMLRKNGVDKGMVSTKIDIQKDPNLGEDDFKALVKNIQRDYASLSLTNAFNDGVYLNNKEGLNSASTSNFSASYKDANDRNQSFNVIRAFIKMDKVGIDGSFEGELSFVLKDRAGKLKGIKNSYAGIPVKGIVESLMRGTIHLDETPHFGRGNVDYNGFNRLSAEDKNFVKAMLERYNDNFKEVFDKTVEKMSSGFKVPTMSEFKAEIEAKVDEEAANIRKFGKREPTPEELEEARTNYRSEIEKKYKDEFEKFLAELPKRIADSFGSNSNKQMGVTVSSAIQSLFNGKEYGNRRIATLGNDLFEQGSVKDGVSSLNTEAFSDIFNKKIDNIVRNGAKIAGYEAKIADVEHPSVTTEQLQIEEESKEAKLAKINSDTIQAKKVSSNDMEL